MIARLAPEKMARLRDLTRSRAAKVTLLLI
jgi:hypothetical protein